MNIQLTQHQAIVLLVSVQREIRSEQQTLAKTANPVLRAMVQESIAEKQQIARTIDQAMDAVVLGIHDNGKVTVQEVTPS